ncbi:cell division protein ZapB [Saccharomonospora xinjiangensis]|uniref:FtsB family cell division protein n=1 Tax=Saccharomonospora xinjiangensis TaxID=75294 RepID=UPI00106F5292|nr:cell division protein ZapB [Saccharomonospora xinjiangensis]QBQ61134.1 Cell division protein FtsL [Saccharomonospora xinjiangensis]
MTVPTRSRAASRPRSSAPAEAPSPSTGSPSRRGTASKPNGRRSPAAQRAYARRAERTGTARGTRGKATAARLGLQNWPRSRATFVIVLMALMLCGVATSLWLSTQAIADSYRLDQLKERNAQLAERAEQLRREVGQLQSPSSLAERAEALGMVPGGNPARLVVKEDGSITVVGEPVEAAKPRTATGPGADGTGEAP